MLDLPQIAYRRPTFANRSLFPLLALCLLASAIPASAAGWNVILDKSTHKCDVTQQNPSGNKTLIDSDPDFTEACKIACKAFDEQNSNSEKCWNYEDGARSACFDKHVALPISAGCVL